jgi:hypothetical protein
MRRIRAKFKGSDGSSQSLILAVCIANTFGFDLRQGHGGATDLGMLLMGRGASTPRSPQQNAYVERLIGLARRECIDHTVVFGEAHLCRLMADAPSPQSGLVGLLASLWSAACINRYARI